MWRLQNTCQVHHGSHWRVVELLVFLTFEVYRNIVVSSNHYIWEMKDGSIARHVCFDWLFIDRTDLQWLLYKKLLAHVTFGVAINSPQDIVNKLYDNMAWLLAFWWWWISCGKHGMPGMSCSVTEVTFWLVVGFFRRITMWSIAHNLCKVLNNGLKDTKSHERHSRLLSSVFETSDEERRFFSLQRELFFPCSTSSNTFLSKREAKRLTFQCPID